MFKLLPALEVRDDSSSENDPISLPISPSPQRGSSLVFRISISSLV